MLHKGYYRKSSVEKISGRGSQGAWRQKELIGLPPVVTLTLDQKKLEIEFENWVIVDQKLVAEEELEVALWRLSVWLEDFSTVRVL
jgi:hypothetical protein